MEGFGSQADRDTLAGGGGVIASGQDAGQWLGVDEDQASGDAVEQIKAVVCEQPANTRSRSSLRSGTTWCREGCAAR